MMLRRFCLAAALIAAAMPMPVSAQSEPSAATASDPTQGAPMRAPVIMIVDVQQLLRESNAAKSIQRQIGALRQNFQKEIADEEKLLTEQEKTLRKQRSVLSPENFKAEFQKFEANYSTAQRKMQGHKRQLDMGLSKALIELRQNIVQVVRDIAKERNVDMVLNDQQVIIVNKSLDVTDEVMRRLNEKIADIKVTLPPLPAASKPSSSSDK